VYCGKCVIGGPLDRGLHTYIRLRDWALLTLQFLHLSHRGVHI